MAVAVYGGGKRDLDRICTAVLDALQAGAAYRDHGLVFCSRRGTPILSSNLIRSFHGLMRRLGFPAHLTPHNLRHTCATNLLYAGRPLPEVAQYLGHANQGVTATIYAHVIARGTHATAEALAERFRAASAATDSATGSAIVPAAPRACSAPSAPASSGTSASSPASSPVAPPDVAAGAR